MFYKLKERYTLCGWDKLPYAVFDTEKYSAGFMTRQQFAVLRMCNGSVDMDGIAITEEQQKILAVFLQLGLVESLSHPPSPNKPLAYQTYLARFIGAAHWSITGNCNYRCKHCYMSAPQARYGELSLEQCLYIVDQLAECGVMNVALTGGEPLVHPHFMEIVKRLQEKKIRITTIYSNGKLVTKELLEQLLRLDMRPEFNMSFDGVGMHDWLRGTVGAERNVLDAFRLCSEMGFPTGAEYCLHAKNKNLLRESINLLASLKVGSLKVSAVAPIGECLDNQGELLLSDGEVFDAYLDYIPHFFEDGMPISIMLSSCFLAQKSSVAYRIPAIKAPPGGCAENMCICGHARNVMYISPDGRLLPCMPLSGLAIQKAFPSILETPLARALTDSYYLSVIDTRLSDYLSHNPECAACQYRLQCCGGCRGKALCTDENDYLSIDRTACAIFQGGYIEKIKQTAESARRQFCMERLCQSSPT